MSENGITETNTNTTCVICLDDISENPETYEIECGHKYHTSCIINWFRNGSKTCPLCNDTPSISNVSEFSPWAFTNSQLSKQRLQNIRKIGNKKNANPAIKKDFLKLRDLKKDGEDNYKKFTAFKKTPEYKNTIKTGRELRKKLYASKRKVQKQELKILTSYPLLCNY